MNDDLHSLLSDLARYLDQQRATGSTFSFEGEEPRPEDPAVEVAPAPEP